MGDSVVVEDLSVAACLEGLEVSNSGAACVSALDLVLVGRAVLLLLLLLLFDFLDFFDFFDFLDFLDVSDFLGLGTAWNAA